MLTQKGVIGQQIRKAGAAADVEGSLHGGSPCVASRDDRNIPNNVQSETKKQWEFFIPTA